ncbi:ankyrin repeat-containing protein At5g02620-like isoform X2 [Cornus florida]|uniref:ankyrin repeat-containing protein At5g02620-like isoform X2 n=1 Tax=Cornus florida TaxID=4283 RepID=UPI00289D8E4E|nr:ankyrin repeat-containing protein At5g02620-like isoform X2 [Cornus florida]
MDHTVDERGLNKDLYDALIRGDGEKVIELCQKLPEGALHILTIHNDTVLHMATYSKQKDLVVTLLRDLPKDHLHKLTHQNDIGNTILHEAATSNRIVPAAKELLQMAPELLTKRNKRGETAVFRAARYGKNEMFEFLDGEVNKLFETEGVEEAQKAFYQRKDKTTILHMSILYEYFDLALWIARRYKYLVDVRDGDRMTALQLLACNSSAFMSGRKHSSLKRLVYSCVQTQDTAATEEGVLPKDTAATEEGYIVPLWEAIRKRKQRFESALKLAKFLIAMDTSWEATESAMDQSKPKTHKYGVSFHSSKGQELEEREKDLTSNELSTVKTAETPLFLATKEGILEIVEEILNTYPQAVEHIDGEGRNILHVAIKYRQIHIFDFVAKMEIPMIRLIRKTDNSGNSILHMVGVKAQDQKAEEMRSPALILQEDLLLFERVQNISATHFVKHFNSKGQTAEVLFATNNDQLRKDAQEWLKRTAENCSIVAVLIATVAFAAAYTVPGGPNQSTGYPLLLNNPFFVIFTMTDVLSLTFALTSVIAFLSILTSPFRLKDFKQSLPQKLMLGVTLLILSVSMMMLAFASTIILMIRNKEQWTRITLCSVAFLPVTIFAFSYLPLYVSLMETFKYSLKKIGDVFPRCSSAFIRSRVANSLGFSKSQTKIPSKTMQSQATSSTCSTYACKLQTTHSFV